MSVIRRFEGSRRRLFISCSSSGYGPSEVRPTRVVEAQGRDAQGGDAVVVGVVRVVDVVVVVTHVEDGVVTGAAEALTALQDERAAAREQRESVAIGVGTGDAARAADHDLVGAVRALTARVDRLEEVVEAVAVDEVRRLDGGVVARRNREQIGPVALTVVVEPDELEAAPEAPEREPELAVVVLERARSMAFQLSLVEPRFEHTTAWP